MIVVVWLRCWCVGWLVGVLVGWLRGWLIGWWVGWSVAERKVPPTCVSVSRFVLPLTASACFRDAENCVHQT